MASPSAPGGPPVTELRLFSVDRRRSARGRARRSFDRSVTALRADDALPEHLEALVTLGRVMADQLDAADDDRDESRFTVARVAATYQAALLALVDRTTGDGPTSADLGAILAALEDGPAADLEHQAGDAAAVPDAS